MHHKTLQIRKQVGYVASHGASFLLLFLSHQAHTYLHKVERTYIFCRSWISDCTSSSPHCMDIQLPYAQVHGIFCICSFNLPWVYYLNPLKTAFILSFLCLPAPALVVLLAEQNLDPLQATEFCLWVVLFPLDMQPWIFSRSSNCPQSPPVWH